MTIIAKKDIFNGGKCFTKDKEYEAKWVRQENGVKDLVATNDQGQPYLIAINDFHIKN